MPHVLVIDDDEGLLGMMQVMLRRAGYEVLVARDGKEGIKLGESTHVDLVVTDIVMPEMEGLETIMKLKQKFPGLKIIAVSGGGRYDPDGYLNMAAALGADKTLGKPFRQEELLETVKKLLG